jgi:hypothetical protein
VERFDSYLSRDPFRHTTVGRSFLVFVLQKACVYSIERCSVPNILLFNVTNIAEKIEKSYEEIQKMKREGKDPKERTRLEKKMQKDNATLSGMRMYSMIFLSIAMLVLYQVIKRWYSDVAVAKLPFVPFAFFTKMTHSGLSSTDMTDCSFVSGLYAPLETCSLCHRTGMYIWFINHGYSREYPEDNWRNSQGCWFPF